MKPAGAGFGERPQLRALRDRAVLLESPLREPEMHPADHIGILMSRLEQRAAGEPYDGTASIRAGPESDLVEQGDHLAPRRRRTRSGLGTAGTSELVTPLHSSGDRILMWGGTGPMDRGGEGSGKAGVLRSRGGIATRGLIEPGGPPATGRCRLMPVSEAVAHQSLEVFANRVGMQAGRGDQRHESGRLGLRPQGLQQRSPRLGQRGAGAARAGGRPVARPLRVRGVIIFHGVECNKIQMRPPPARSEGDTMSELVIASSEADAKAADAVRQHHAELAGALSLRTEELVAAAARHDTPAAELARRDLVDWCDRELIPHARAEEQSMYPAAQGTVEGRLLVEAMLGEHEVIARLVRGVADAADLVRAAPSATALHTVFDSHLAKENDLVLPLLAATPGISVAELLGGLHELLGHAEHPAPDVGAGCSGHGCACGGADDQGYPELDARSIPHSIRHATIFGAMESVRPGGGLVLVAPHDPLPLLEQVSRRWPGAFTVQYLERGPETWRLSFLRNVDKGVVHDESGA